MPAFGVISSFDFRMGQMSAFELLTILVLFVGGLGLFLRSLEILPLIRFSILESLQCPGHGLFSQGCPPHGLFQWPCDAKGPVWTRPP